MCIAVKKKLFSIKIRLVNCRTYKGGGGTTSSWSNNDSNNNNKQEKQQQAKWQTEFNVTTLFFFQ